ncbi:hypothetical protein [Nocardia sp. XZ_19_385]|uniref:LppU/SCO3897 family protein n=1 Tax=Nocardia sp. XZ_19_385 TaxID=2769488 RepID=UPI00188FC23D|nr:hypothetical protein [Nocardia sp. XZ_19_385]
MNSHYGGGVQGQPGYGHYGPSPVYPGAGYSPGPGYPPPHKSRGPIVALVIVLILVVGGGAGGWWWYESQKNSVIDLLGEGARQPIRVPATGDCTNKSGQVMISGPIDPVDCADPTATWQVVVSELERDGQCASGQIRITTDGTRDGDYTIVTSCAKPNLTEGNCYKKYGSTYEFDPVCADGSARFDRRVLGVADTKVCEEGVPTEAGKDSEFIARTFLFPFVDEEEPATYCFVPAGW